MIKTIEVINHRGDTLTIGMGDSDTSGFLITSIDGLSPTKATINSTEMATGDGSIFNSSRLESRNLVLHITLNPDMNIEESRLKLYRYFSVKKAISLVFETDNRMSRINGYVESNEIDIFSNSESVTISIVCPDPYFYESGANAITRTNFSDSEDSFEFPFSNESLEEPLLTFSIVNITERRTLYYTGDSDIGIVIRIKALSTIGDILITKTKTNDLMKIRSNIIEKITGAPIGKNDEVIISTERNNKFVKLLRNGKYYNILNSLDRKSTWFKIDQGDNVFAYNAYGHELDLEFSIENRTIYEGL